MKIKHDRDGVALYHVVLAHEDFNRTVYNLLRLIRRAQRKCPGQKRTLFLDIEGHRHSKGGFDQDMLEFQSKFTTEFLLQFLSRVVMPLATIENPHPQNDDIPDALNVVSLDNPDNGCRGEPPSGP
jgi:hypothetical protein